MRRVLRKREGSGWFRLLRPPARASGRPLQAERQQERAGTPRRSNRPAGRGKCQAAGSACPGLPSRHWHRFPFIVSRIAIVQPARVDPRAGSYAFTPRRVSDARQPKSPLLAKGGGARPPDAECSLRNAVIGQLAAPQRVRRRAFWRGRGHRCRDSPTLSKAGWSTALADLKRWESVEAGTKCHTQGGVLSVACAQCRVSCARSVVSIVLANLGQLPRERVERGQAADRAGGSWIPQLRRAPALERCAGALRPSSRLLSFS